MELKKHLGVQTKMRQLQYAAEKVNIERVELTQIVTEHVVITIILAMEVMEWKTNIGTRGTAFPRYEFICKYEKVQVQVCAF